jgi:dihydroorotase
MSSTIFKNGKIVNEGKIIEGDLLITNGRIEKIASSIDSGSAKEVDATDRYIIPGIIDDQVHFREPGLTYKADIASESRAAIAGGVTTFMEMPNTKPSALTQELLQDKYDIANKSAYANYSFFMGASNDNIEEVLKTNAKNVCGVKVFMGSSTGKMLVDNEQTLKNIFSKVDALIATHCEDETTIRKNLALYQEKYGDNLLPQHHPEIRSREGCYKSSSLAAGLAKEYNSRLHILHISTKEELDLFTNKIPLEEKRITSEACVHHMFFEQSQYAELGNKIKCNPAIKHESDREAIFQAVLDDTIDIIATDHAPHTMEEKARPYSSAPSGLPLIQHTLNIMLDFYKKDKISLEKIVEKMCHTPAICFQVKERGFLREGFMADIVLVDVEDQWTIQKENIYYKCGWSPLEGRNAQGRIISTYVNGIEVYNHQGKFVQGQGSRIEFARP